ncbi:MAG: bifunctional 4-hydroxy-2-oxoglutarate aldolase/2-dehydro-3-deoxy-phosphogluconate aldolase [Pirellulales bacterium]
MGLDDGLPPESMPAALTARLAELGVVAVLVIDDPAQAVPLAESLLEGGVAAMELTLRTPAALESLQRIRAAVPQMLAGIGTVLTPGQVEAAHAAGAQFAVAPGLNPRVVEQAQRLGLPFAPGIATPSELELALELGCRTVKFFPAEPLGGLKYLSSLAAPYAHLGVRYVPLGGVSQDNLAAYLAQPSVLAVGGSWLASRDDIRGGAWSAIRQRAADAMAIVRQVRKGS